MQALIFSFLAVIAPIQGLLLITALFVGLDTIVGIWASVKAGYKFRSSRLFNLVTKTFFYMSTIFLGFLIDKHMFGGSALGIEMLNAKLMTAVWIYIEVKSLDEKSIMLGNRSIWTILKDLTKKIKSIKDDIKEII